MEVCKFPYGEFGYFCTEGEGHDWQNIDWKGGGGFKVKSEVG